MIAKTPKDFGQILRDARIKRGMTQGELAKTLGISRHSVLRMERGDPTGLETILRAAQTLRMVLDLRPDRLAGDPATSIDIDAIVRRAKGGAT